MKNYHCLNNSTFYNESYSLVPLRFEDRRDIMKWRNEQIYHLRQNKILSEEDQDNYFNNVVAKLFDQSQPNQILFSYLENDVCIGYGVLVHINWIDKNAEISFIMNTELEKDNFQKHWSIFLQLIEKVAFEELNFHKIFTYAFDLRPHLYEALEGSGYKEGARLKEHCLFEGKFIDVLIHLKINSTKFDFKSIKLREANINDAELLFNWANESNVRKNAINQDKINWVDHLNWLNKKLNDDNTKIFILFSYDNLIGQIRIDLIDHYWNIDYSIDSEFRGLGFGKEILKLLINKFEFYKYKAVVKKENTASIKVFQNLGFHQVYNFCDEYYTFFI